MPDLSTCLAAVHLTPGLYPTLANDLVSGKVAYDGSAAARCLDHLRTLQCSLTAQLRLGIDDPDCSKTLAGQIPAGAVCFFGDECSDHGSCTRTDDSCTEACCPGTCAPALIQLGGDCSASGARCVGGAACTALAGGASSTCVALPDREGADCSSAGACALPLICIPDPATSARTCRNAAGTGAACAALPCDDARDTCDSSTKVCRRRGKPGESCATGSCVSYASCDATTQLCVALGKIGDRCVPTCLDGLTCDPTSQTCAGLTPDVPACG
jgi:hypothetical protein